MSVRDDILKTIKANKPSFCSLPEVPLFSQAGHDLIHRFTKNALANGSQVLPDPDQLNDWIKIQFPKARKILSLVDQFPGNIHPDPALKPGDLQYIDLAICYTPLGVAENGAIWLSEKETKWRILPFITQHLIVFLRRSDIVLNMHEAYEKLGMDTSGFSVFIGGPSKTADIEQSLVVGAQGTRSHTIILY
jgi:L-lactate dehydrogenase complex protein LldG